MARFSQSSGYYIVGAGILSLVLSVVYWFWRVKPQAERVQSLRFSLETEANLCFYAQRLNLSFQQSGARIDQVRLRLLDYDNYLVCFEAGEMQLEFTAGSVAEVQLDAKVSELS
ncbi:MAG: hypothetical protein H6765_04885 [Candidatus Peribacteria bacterium]|nr:MAG: hypothetical protein H6765_04885 [Candidatus Peribacteria bacterium]